MEEPVFGDVSVEWPPDHDLRVVRTRVLFALEEAGFGGRANEFLSATNGLTDPTEMWKATSRFVYLSMETDAGGAVGIPQGNSRGGALAAFLADVGQGGARFQYAMVDMAVVSTEQRLAELLGEGGAVGWEVVAVLQRGANQAGGGGGTMLMKRQLPDGVRLSPEDSCIELRANDWFNRPNYFTP